MPWMLPAAIIGSSLFGASKQASAASQATQASSDAAAANTALQKQIYEESVARQKPFLDIGTEYTNKLAAMLRGGPEAQQSFLTMDPGYGFRLSEGQKALERSAAARGGLLSGAAGKALTRYGQDFASNEFQNAFNRYGTLASLGPSAAGVTNTLGQTYATNVGNIGMQNAINAGNAALARGSAYQNTIGGLINYLGRSTAPAYQYGMPYNQGGGYVYGPGAGDVGPQQP